MLDEVTCRVSDINVMSQTELLLSKDLPVAKLRLGYIFLQEIVPYPKLESLVRLLPINGGDVEVEINLLLWAHQLYELVQMLGLKSPRVVDKVME